MTNNAPITNIFSNCKIVGGNDCLCYSSYVNSYDCPIQFTFKNVEFINGWDSVADFGSPYDTYNNDPTSFIKFYNCTFACNIASNTYAGANPAGDGHIFNLAPYPSVTIVGCSGSFYGCRIGIYNNNNPYPSSLYAVTNSTLVMADSHFDYFCTTNGTVGGGNNPALNTPVDFCKFFNKTTTNIFVQNVSWTSNGVPFNLEYFTSPTNYCLNANGLITVYSNGVLSSLSGTFTGNGGGLTNLNAGSLIGNVPLPQLTNVFNGMLQIGNVISNTASAASPQLGTFISVNSSSSVGPDIFSGLAPLLANGGEVYGLSFGVAGSTYNWGGFGFYYSGSGSRANRLGLSFYGTPDLWTMDTYGSTTNQGNSYTAGTVTGHGGFISSNGTGASATVGIQTNAVGPHGISLQFTNGLYIGNSIY